MTNMDQEKIIAYKGFDKDFKGKGFQYKIGKEYQYDGKISCCNCGFHACENPLEALDYYPELDSRFAIVEQSGEIDREVETSKVCSSQIYVREEIKLIDIIELGVKWLVNKADLSGLNKSFQSSKNFETIGSSTDYAMIECSGDWTNIGSSGFSTIINASGRNTKIGSSGKFASISSSGDGSVIGSSGDHATINNAGCFSHVYSFGYCASICHSGSCSYISSFGDFAKISSSGKGVVITSSGQGCKARGKIGSWITLTERGFDEEKRSSVIKCVKTEYIDGKRIKANTWYQLVNGKFVKVNE